MLAFLDQLFPPVPTLDSVNAVFKTHADAIQTLFRINVILFALCLVALGLIIWLDHRIDRMHKRLKKLESLAKKQQPEYAAKD